MTETNPSSMTQCPGCKAFFPKTDDFTALHPYGINSSACWSALLAILAYEAEHLGYPPEHQLIVDAYAVQHPQNSKLQKQLNIEERLVRASVQSVGRHLVRLYCRIEKKIPPAASGKIMAHVITHGRSLEMLDPPVDLGKITCADFSPEFTTDQYKEFAWNWASSAWDAWEMQHDTVRRWVKEYAPHVG